jgi:PAS domain S-box-containing protein
MDEKQGHTGRGKLRKTEQFRELVENINVGIVVLDRHWNFTFVNPIAADMLHRLGEPIMGKNIWEEFPEAVGKKFYHSYHEALLTQKPVFTEGYSSVMGKWIKAAIYPSVNSLSIYFHDITQQKRAETIAKENEYKYIELIDRITDGFIALDKKFRYTYINKKAGEMIHRNPESMIGKNVWQEFPQAVGSATYGAYMEAWTKQHYVNNVDYFAPLDLWFENHIYPSTKGISVIIRDITGKMKVEKEKRKLERDMLEQTKQQQLRLIETTLQAQEEERTHIGRELHDNVNQIIVATNLMLSLIRDDPSKAPVLIKKCISNLEKAIKENRNLAHELVTPDLEKQSLCDQLHDFIKPMLSAKGVALRINDCCFDENKLNKKQKLSVYRIVQEQCTNIAKYAKAATATVTLVTKDHQFQMIIADNGKGNELSKTKKGIGLKNIEGRMRLFNGEMKVNTAPGKGFQLEVSMPITSTEQAE